MTVQQLVVDPNICFDWKRRPLAANIAVNKKPKILVVNDLWLNDLKQANANEIYLSNSENAELIFSKDVVLKNNELNLLVESYFSLDLHKKYPFNRKTLLMFLKLIVVASENDKADYLDILKKWYRSTKDDLNNIFTDLSRVSKSKPLSQAIEVFKANPKYTEQMMDFLWSLHGTHKANSQYFIGSKSRTIVIPATRLKKNSYEYMLLVFALYHNYDVLLDSNVRYDLFKDFLSNSKASLYIYRQSTDNQSEIANIASYTSDMWSCAQNSNQEIFIGWSSKNAIRALKEYSINDFSRLHIKSPYNTYVGRYYAIQEQDLVLAKYDDKNHGWIMSPFDIGYITENTIDKDKIYLSDVQNEILNLTEIITNLSKSSFTSDTDGKEIEKIENNYFEKIKELLNSLEEKIEQVTNTSKDNSLDSSAWSNDLTSSEVNRQFEEALSKQDSSEAEYTDFDS